MTVTAAVIIATTRVYDMPGLLALAPWTDDEALIEWQLAQVLAAGVRDVEVVIPPDADGDAIIPLVARDNVEPVVDTRDKDIASAIQAGVTALPRGTTDAVIIDLAQPIDRTTLQRAIDSHDATIDHDPAIEPPLGCFVAGEQLLGRLRNMNDDEALRRLGVWNTLDTAIRSRETYERYRDALT